MREAADTLVLAPSSDHDARAALAAARGVLVGIRRDELESWIEQLADDLEDAGPVPINAVAVSLPTPERTPVMQGGGSARR